MVMVIGRCLVRGRGRVRVKVRVSVRVPRALLAHRTGSPRWKGD